MRFYRVVYFDPAEGYMGQTMARWFTVGRDAQRFYNAKYREFIDPDWEGDKPVYPEIVDVPTNKRELLAFLNAECELVS